MSGTPPAEHPPGNRVTHAVTVEPGMCGPTSLFAGRVGDWTWRAVSALCGVDALNARNAAGAPTYLAFSSFHIRGCRAMHPGRLAFGDRLDVATRLFDLGSESVLALHRISTAGAPRAGRLYVRTFNRWIVRGVEHSNAHLVRSSPVGFRHRHLGAPPAYHSPRLMYGHARAHRVCRAIPPGYEPVAADVTIEYPIDITRDLNAVGLVYFAAYFGFVDRAVLALWRHLGRTDRAFLRRRVVDQRLCYLSNAEPDAVLSLRVAAWHRAGDPADEIVNVVAEDAGTGRLAAVSTLRLLGERA